MNCDKAAIIGEQAAPRVRRRSDPNNAPDPTRFVQIKKISPKYSVIALAIVMVAAWLLVATKPEPEARLKERAPMRVVVTEVVAEDFRPTVEVSGHLRPARTARPRFQVSGVVVERRVDAGMAVAAGEALLRLDEGDYRDAVAEARARLRQEEAALERDRRLLELARSNRELQEREVARQERLGDQSLASRATLDGARQKLFQLETEEARLRYSVETAGPRLELLRAALRKAERNLERTVLRAPFDAVVDSVVLEVGDPAGPGQPALELVDLTALDLQVEVTGETAAALKLGQTVSVVAGGRHLEGRVAAISPAPAEATFTHRVRVRLAGAGGLLPGTVARVLFPLEVLEQVALVPAAAVVRDDGQAWAFVVRGERLERRELILGPRDGARQVVLSGLAPGEQVVARDAAALTEEVTVEY